MKLVGFLSILLLAGCSRQPPTAPSPAAATEAPQATAASESENGIRMGQVTSQPPSGPILANGHLAVNEDATWMVGALTSGKITQVLAKTGDPVKAGDVLAWMHSDDVHNTRATYRQNLDELERRKILRDHARRVRDRAQRLFDLKAASREQLEAAETELRNTEHAVATAEIDIEKEKTHLTEFLEIPLDDSSQSQIPIRAPFGGTVTDRMSTVGSVVTAGSHVFTISNLRSLWMIASVNEADLAGVRVGQTVRVTVKSYPGETFPGRVLKLGERLEVTTRTLPVRVAVPNPDGRLKPEMFASAEIAGTAAAPILVVPDSAIQQLDGATVVFVKNAAGAFEPRKVETSGSQAGYTQISNGLRAGEAIVVKGAFLLKSERMKGAGE